PMLIAATAIKRRRLCFPAAALAALENFYPSRLRHLRRLSWLPTGLSLPRLTAHDVPAKDLVFSSISWSRLLPREVFFRRMQTAWRPCVCQWRGQPISSRPSTPLQTPPPAVCVSTSPAPAGLLANAFPVAGFSFLTFSAS